MTSLRELRQRITGVHVLDDVVGAMRSIAGIRLRQASRTFTGLAAYADGLERTLASVLAFWPEAMHHFADRAKRGPQRLVVFGSEHGFVGGYNDRLLELAATQLTPGDQIHVVGKRAARIAKRRGLPMAGTSSMLARPDRVERAALELAAIIWPAYLDGSITKLTLLHSREPRGDAPDPVSTVAAPPLLVPATSDRQPPLLHLPPETLVVGLIGELVIARLNLAFVEALRAENTLRLRAMDRAKRNVENRLGDLRQTERQLLQELTTNEILEIVNGANADAR